MPNILPRSFFPLAVCLALCVLPSVASAQRLDVEIAGGASVTKDNETAPVASVAWLPALRDFDRATLRWDLGVIHVRGRDDTGRDLDEDVTVAHAGLRYERLDIGLTAGFGVGVQHGHSDALSGDPQFVSTLGWRWQRFSLLARHISNARLHEPNHGETMLVAAWRF